MSVISAGTTTTTAFKVTGDTTGTLQLQTGAVPTTAINISATQVVTFPATTTLDFTGTLLLGDGSAAAPTLAHSGDTNTGMFFPAADTIAFTEGGVEAARFDSSGNLGIGTTSPAYKLDVRGVTASGNGTITTGFSWDTRGLVGTFSNHSLGFLANGAVRATLDTAGNLGLGVTPSAWGQGRAFEVLEQGYGVWNGTGSAYLLANTYFNSGFKYANTGAAASHYYQFQGAHVWSTAPSGTAGNAISFTQAMTLDASSVLLLGNTSNYGVGSFEANSLQARGPIVLAANNTGSADNRNWIFQANAAAAGAFSLAYSSTNTGWPNAAYAMVVNRSGNVGIGTTNPNRTGFDANAQVLTVYGPSRGFFELGSASPINNDTLGGLEFVSSTTNKGFLRCRLDGSANGILAFGTNNTERVRIGSDGAFMVRTTVGPTGAWNGNSIANINGGLQLTHPAGTGRWRQLSWSGDGNDGNLYFPGGSSLATVANVAWLDQAGVWINASDARQKTNIREIHHGLASVLQTQPRAYNRNGIKDNFVGFVAQELKQVIPEVVRGSDETSYGVDYGSLVAVAFKAIQELSAKVAALESK